MSHWLADLNFKQDQNTGNWWLLYSLDDCVPKGIGDEAVVLQWYGMVYSTVVWDVLHSGVGWFAAEELRANLSWEAVDTTAITDVFHWRIYEACTPIEGIITVAFEAVDTRWDWIQFLRMMHSGDKASGLVALAVILPIAINKKTLKTFSLLKKKKNLATKRLIYS
ncbi:hypothetical protein SLEP1_g39724 [Rubroshorea leprosula]|uniref:Uncharacterized protein n=1 Tax=Rubroshorea leprosula TaxID=152421 RepID=A0AAV5L1X5_9ROSI|nr:hypothetical protein SLEP1_g39724 [Rubroshorea leprosula]